MLFLPARKKHLRRLNRLPFVPAQAPTGSTVVLAYCILIPSMDCKSLWRVLVCCFNNENDGLELYIKIVPVLLHAPGALRRAGMIPCDQALSDLCRQACSFRLVTSLRRH